MHYHTFFKCAADNLKKFIEYSAHPRANLYKYAIIKICMNIFVAY